MKGLSKILKPSVNHCYSVFNLKDLKYFENDYFSRAEAYQAMLDFMESRHLVLEGKNEATHCKEYDCSNGYRFFINREY